MLAAYNFLLDCLHGLFPGPLLLSYPVFDFIFSLFFVSGPCARLSWPSRQLLAHVNLLYRIVSYRKFYVVVMLNALFFYAIFCCM